MNPQAERVLDLFQKTGAWLEGHFRLTSGLHSGGYLQSALVLQYPHYAEILGRKIAEALSPWTEHEPVNAVVAPALGGLIIGHEVARGLGVRFIFTERDSDRRMALRRGFTVTPGEKIVVVEDVITTGGSTREVVDLMRALGALPVAAGSIIDRSAGAADVGIARVALETLAVPTWEPDHCLMCEKGEPVVKPGSRPV